MRYDLTVVGVFDQLQPLDTVLFAGLAFQSCAAARTKIFQRILPSHIPYPMTLPLSIEGRYDNPPFLSTRLRFATTEAFHIDDDDGKDKNRRNQRLTTMNRTTTATKISSTDNNTDNNQKIADE